MSITLHRYAANHEPGDLTLHDLVILWGVMQAENLVEVFFHDGSVTSLPEFIRYATDKTIWFYGVKHGGAFIGFGVVNGFSPSGNTAFVHLCSFEGGRKAGDSANSPFAEAGRQWFKLLSRKSPRATPKGAIAPREAEQGELCSPPRFTENGLDTVIAVFPACYRGVRQWVTIFGFTESMRLPGALRLVRKSGVRITDALVYSKTL